MSNYFVNFPVPDIPVWNPVESQGRMLTLRQLADARQYQQMQMRRLEMQEREAEQEYRERESFQRDFTGTETPEEIFRRWPTFGPKVLKAHGEALTQQRLAAGAELTRQQAQEKLDQAAKERELSALDAIRSMEDPETRGRMFMEWQAKNQRLGRGVTWPLTDRSFEFLGKNVLGPAGWQDYITKAQKSAQETALYPLQTREQLARTATAEGEATGTQPVSPYQKAQLEQNRWGSPEGLVSVLSDPKASEADKERALSGLQRHIELRKAGAASTVISPNQTIANEAKTRDDYIRDTKNFPTIRDAYSKIVGASKSHTGPGDISLLYGYMRMLDPGSTVREGEFATAQNAGGVPERIRAMWNKLLTGERLDPAIRTQFVDEAGKIYGQSYADYRKTRDVYTGIANRSGMDPRNVVIDLDPATPPGIQPSDKKATHVYDPATGKVRPK